MPDCCFKTPIEIPDGVPSKFGLCPQNYDTKPERVHIPSAECWSGHAGLTGIHNISFYEELSKLIIKYSSYVKSDKVAHDIYIMASLLTVL